MFSNLQFLVADDHAFQRRSVVRMLSGLPVKQVVDVADGNAAFDALNSAQQNFDILICDLDMPGMTGMELLWRIAQTRRNVSVILLSRLGPALLHSVADEARAFGINVIGAVQKPMTQDQLVELVVKAGGLPRTAANEAGTPATSSRRIAVAGDPLPREIAPIDWTVFREMWRLEGDSERELLIDFCASNRDDAAALEAALERRERVALARAAHRISGASHAMGAMQLSAACTELENCAGKADWDRLRGLVQRIGRCCEDLDRYVKSRYEAVA